MSGDGINLYDEDGLRYAPAPKAPIKRALISRILSFLHRAPPARARRQAMKARVRAWEHATNGVLYIIPADPSLVSPSSPTQTTCTTRSRRALGAGPASSRARPSFAISWSGPRRAGRLAIGHPEIPARDFKTPAAQPSASRAAGRRRGPSTSSGPPTTAARKVPGWCKQATSRTAPAPCRTKPATGISRPLPCRPIPCPRLSATDRRAYPPGRRTGPKARSGRR